MEIPTDLCASELSLSEGNLKLNTLTALRNLNIRLRALETATTPAAPNVEFVSYTTGSDIIPDVLSEVLSGDGTFDFLKMTLPDGSVKYSQITGLY